MQLVLEGKQGQQVGMQQEQEEAEGVEEDMPLEEEDKQQEGKQWEDNLQEGKRLEVVGRHHRDQQQAGKLLGASPYPYLRKWQ